MPSRKHWHDWNFKATALKDGGRRFAILCAECGLVVGEQDTEGQAKARVAQLRRGSAAIMWQGMGSNRRARLRRRVDRLTKAKVQA